MIDINGKTAILTGASAGIGLGILHALAAEGVNLAITARRPGPLEEAAAAARAAGVRVLAVPGDVADLDHVRSFVAAAVAEFGAIDYLVNNAGINTDLRNLRDIPLETWQEVVEINLNSVYYIIRELLPHMRVNQHGHIINIISGAGYSLRPNATSGVAYIASKHGVTGLSHAINSEEWDNGIRCSAIYPGEVDTAMLDTDHQRLKPGEAEMVMQPEDIADAVVFAARTHPRALVADVYMQPSHHRNR